MPEPGPFGETFFKARVRAMVEALLLKRPAGGRVESVVTFATQRLFFGCFRDEVVFRVRIRLPIYLSLGGKFASRNAICKSGLAQF